MKQRTASEILFHLAFMGVLLILVLLVSIAPAQTGVKSLKNLEYAQANGKKLLLDLYLPETSVEKLPVIVWIHGGGWRGGSKENCLPYRLGFVSFGYAVASLEYRLSGAAPFPAQIKDCKAAIRFLKAHAAEYNLDKVNFGVWGASAGGHLSALLGASSDAKEWDVGDHLEQSSRVKAVCDYYGPSDFSPMLERMKTSPNYNAHAAISGLFGGNLEDRDKIIKAGPVAHVTKDDPPYLIVHGDQDALVPLSQSEILYDTLKKAGVEADLHIIKGSAHGGPAFSSPEMISLVRAFFDKHLKKTATSRPAETRPQPEKILQDSAPTSPTAPSLTRSPSKKSAPRTRLRRTTRID